MHDDLKRRLRAEVDAQLGSRPPRDLAEVLGRGRSKRLALRLVTTISMVLLGTAIVAGGIWIGQNISSNDEALPPANSGPEETTGSSGRMWPQSNLQEAREAQRLADEGDPRYTWQLLPGEATVEPGDVELFNRFLREKLGWQKYSWGIGPEAFPPGWPNEFVVVRCAEGETNALYPNDPDGRACAPTLNGNRYETVMIRAASQPYSVARARPSAIWIVTRWEMLEPADTPVDGIDIFEHQIQQMEPPSEVEATEYLRGFLQARVDGEGAKQFFENEDFSPILYTSFSGAPYERFDFELVRGPVWPAGWYEFKVRLFPEGEKPLVEKLFVEHRGDRLEVFGVGSSDDEIAYGDI